MNEGVAKTAPLILLSLHFIEQLIPGHATPLQRVALLVGAVKPDVAPVVPTAILFGKLGVRAVIEVAEFVRTVLAQLQQMVRVNEFDVYVIELNTHETLHE